MKRCLLFVCGRSGFTLLEVVIVLALLGFMAGLALPRMERLYTGMQESMQRSEALRCIADLGYQAWLQQQPLTLSHYPPNKDGDRKSSSNDVASPSLQLTAKNFPLPDNWSVEAETPIVYQRNGICSGGTLLVRFREIENTYTLSPPFCLPRQVEGPSS